MSSNWLALERQHMDLGHVVREERMSRMIEDFCQNPGGSVKAVSKSEAASHAAYRFLESDKIEFKSMIDGQAKATRARTNLMPEKKRFLILNDTMYLNLTRPSPIKGSGPIGNHKEQGLLVHSGLAVTVTGVPQGIVSQQVWGRDPEKYGQKKDRGKRRFKEKESHKWVRTLEDVNRWRNDLSMELVVIGDQESDIYDLFAAPREDTVHYLVRATGNRKVTENANILEFLAARPVNGKTDISLNRAPGRRARTAKCHVTYATITLQPPYRKYPEEKYGPVILTAVWCREPHPPKGQAGISWLLLTTLPVESTAAALECVRYYTYRWLIEQYHRVLKGGCRIEERQLRTKENMERMLGIFNYVAWRLLWILYRSREAPQACCEEAFSREEWMVLYARLNGKVYRKKTPPTLADAVKWIATLGGYWGRKNDGPPGIIILWRGMTALQETLATAEALTKAKFVANA